MDKITLSLDASTFHNDKTITYATDSLVTSHYFAGKKDTIFQKALTQSRKVCRHTLYHEWRLQFAIQTQLQIISRCIRNNEKYSYAECGVGEGHTILMTHNYLKELGGEYFSKWNEASKLLIDTFEGVNKLHVDPEDYEKYLYEAYSGSTLAVVKERLKEITLITFVKGSVPEVLPKIPLSMKSPCFLHIDMNNYVPEVAALQYFYASMKTGSTILLDDYSFQYAKKQQVHIDEWCKLNSIPIPVNIPTGQGLMLI